MSSVFRLFTQQTFTELQRSDGTVGGEHGWQLAGPLMQTLQAAASPALSRHPINMVR